MTTSAQVRVPGPLEPYAVGYRGELEERGYSPWTVVSYMFTVAQVSRWLTLRGLTAGDLRAERVSQFLDERPDPRRATPRGLYLLLEYLESIGALAKATAAASTDPALESMLEKFTDFLRDERGLAERTIVLYGYRARLFFSSRPNGTENLEELGAEQINAFVLAQAARLSSGSLNNTVTALRALLRFLYLRGYTEAQLADAAPRTMGWRSRGPSRDLEPGVVERLLAGCDRRTSTGRRDFAIVTVLARFGLRAAETATLRLDDVNWRAGEITVHGKGSRTDRLPLPVDVGKAIAEYCRDGRPRNECRGLFLKARAPYNELTSDAVSRVVGRACKRAGLPVVGAHRLRHSAAVALRREGAPLFEIGQLLRHRSAVSTTMYARDDLAALAEIARPWPGDAS